MPRRMIGVDLDDVLAATNEVLASFHNANYGTSYTVDQITDWDLGRLWGVSDAGEFMRRFVEFCGSGEHEMMQPVPGSVSAIDMLSRSHTIVIVTARPRSVEQETRQWLETHFPTLVYSLHFQEVEDHFRASKGVICRELGVDVFIDDAAHQIEHVAPHVSHALLFDRPWNRGYQSQVGNVARVHTWEAILWRTG